MPENPSENNSADSGESSRIPRLAIGVVILGVIATLAIYGLSFLPGSGSLEVEWDTVEAIEFPAQKDVGQGSFGVSRTTLSALAPNEDGLLLYRVAGVVRVDSKSRLPVTVRCDVYSRSDENTRIARSSRLRAAWPKPSEELQAQEVPETSFAKFVFGDTKKVDLPIRDVVQRYTDSTASTLVDWPGYNEFFQSWIWTMKDGTGVGAANLPWVVIFEAEDRPKGNIKCRGEIGAKSTVINIPFRQQEWPITDDQPNAEDVGTGDASNVE
ncbi:MAG: hypothetical protein KDB48_01200 [Solirubrobacterales bacterium]|nr:hypothetical protein [Solirubrobacterales bacterium]